MRSLQVLPSATAAPFGAEASWLLFPPVTIPLLLAGFYKPIPGQWGEMEGVLRRIKGVTSAAAWLCAGHKQARRHQTLSLLQEDQRWGNILAYKFSIQHDLCVTPQSRVQYQITETQNGLGWIGPQR